MKEKLGSKGSPYFVTLAMHVVVVHRLSIILMVIMFFLLEHIPSIRVICLAAHYGPPSSGFEAMAHLESELDTGDRGNQRYSIARVSTFVCSRNVDVE